MYNDQNAPFDGEGWNTEDPAFPGLSCNDAGILLTQFVSAFRAILSAEARQGRIQVMRMVRNLLDAQITTIEGMETEEDRNIAEMKSKMGFVALGLAMASSTEIDPRTLGELANKAVETLLQLHEKHNEEEIGKSHLQFFVQKAESNEAGIAKAKVAVAVVPMSEMLEALKQDEDAVKILRLMKQLPDEPSKN